MGSPIRSNLQSGARLDLSGYIKGIEASDRIVLSRAITLIESKLESDQLLSDQLLQKLLPKTGQSIRIGITGIPGVGKSTFIEALGSYLTTISKKVAVLAIDPSSGYSKGSILGDKTRMDNLSKNENAFIRPTSTGGTLGGVADKTREAILLCEAAGYEIIIIETVGVGQSETVVRDMADFFLLLLIGGAGDELQGIKKGIMEMADGVVITKADGENLKSATQAQSDYHHALHLFASPASGWNPKVLISSALEQTGIKETWEMIEGFHAFTIRNGHFEKQRNQQNKSWFHSAIEGYLKHQLLQDPTLKNKLRKAEQQVIDGTLSPGVASRQVVKEFMASISKT